MHDELDDGLTGLDIEAVVLTGLAAVLSAHLPGDVNDAQHAVVALHQGTAIGHGRLAVSARPQQDGLGLA